MKMEMTKDLQKKVKKYGSVLKAFRAQGGGGAGLMAGGIVLLISGIPIGGLCILALGSGGMTVAAGFIVPGLLLVLLGGRMRGKRLKNYLDYYQKQTGYSAMELQEADRELMSPGTVKIGSRTDRSGVKTELVYMITERYFLSIWPVNGCYVRKLDDIVAAFYSSQIPGIGGYREGLFLITRQDTKKEAQKNPFTGKQYLGFENGVMTNQRNCEEICREALEEIVKRAPHIITYQNIVVDNVKYNLLSMDNWQADWARILGE